MRFDIFPQAHRLMTVALFSVLLLSCGEGQGPEQIKDPLFTGTPPVIVVPPPTTPTVAAPTPPARNAADVISLFSDAYADVTVDTWAAGFSAATFADVMIAGNATKEYTALGFAGIEFTGGNAIDVSGMTHFHMDLWTPDNTSFLFKFVDFGGDGFGGGNDSEGPLTFDGASTPALTTGNWVSIDIPISDMTAAGLASLTDLSQLIIDGTPDGGAVYLDNLYFYTTAAPQTAPTTAAPTPTTPAVDVTSVFSDAYTDITGVDFNPNWGQATIYTLESVAGNDTLKYANLNYQGIDFAGNAQDVSGRDTLHLDFWSPDATAVNIYLISAGPVEAPVAIPVATGSWVSVDIPLANFTGVDLTNVIQFKFDDATTGESATIFIDNLYFYTSGGGGGCTASGNNLAINGDFEVGDISCWTDFSAANNGAFSATMAQSNGGSWSGNIVASVPGGGGPASFPVVKQANIGIGTVTPSTNMFISFDMFGSVSGAGGVFFAEFFSELTGGGTSSAVILGGGPLFPTGTWTTHTFTTPTGADVSGGVTLQLKADCGGNPGCTVDAFIDNVCVSAVPGTCF